MDEQALIQSWEQEEQQPFQGWDFSYLRGRYHESSPPWSYDEKVRQLLQNADSLLDMGTGGGEKLLEFRDVFPERTVATEGYPPNIPLATANLKPFNVPVIPYNIDEESRMPFDDQSFARIINRHEAYDAREVARVLKPGGIFCTQQVDGRDLFDLYSLFGAPPSYQHVNLANCQQELENAGLQIQEALDWQGTATFSDVGAVVYYLHAVPWQVPPDFSVQRYQHELVALHRRNSTTFTMRRFFLQAINPKF